MFEVLEIGADIASLAEAIYTEENVGQPVKITHLDANPKAPKVDVIHVLEYPDSPLPFEDNKFDAVVASHILEHIAYWYEVDALADWTRVLKVGGTLNVIVPSWEYVARNVLAEKSNARIKPYAFGGLTTPWDIHVNMFTMQMLRSLFQHVGLNVVRARTGTRMARLVGEEVEVEQHYIAGVKRDPNG